MRRTTWMAVAVTATLLLIPGLLRMAASFLAEGRSEGMLAGVLDGWSNLGEALLLRLKAAPPAPATLLSWGLGGALMLLGILVVGVGLRHRGIRLPGRVRPGSSIVALARRTGVPQDVLRALAESEGSAYPRRSRRGSFFRSAVFAALPNFARIRDNDSNAM